MQELVSKSPFPPDFQPIGQDEEDKLIALAVTPATADSMLRLFRIYAAENVVGFMRFSRALLNSSS